MKDLKLYFSALVIIMLFTLSGCEAIGNIFKAGMWTAVIGIVLIVLLILWLLRVIRGRR